MIPFYPPLDVQTDADPFLGACTPSALIRAAVRRGIHQVGTADRGSLQAVEPMAFLGRPQEVRALAGVVITVRGHGGHEGTLLLYAGAGGWNNLVALCALPSVTQETLAAHSRGLICITGIRGCRLWRLLRQGKPWEADLHLKELAAVFGSGEVYVAMGNSAHSSIKRLRQAASESAARAGVASVTLPTVRHVQVKDFLRLDAMLAMQAGRTLNSTSRPEYLSPWAYWKDQRELSHDYLEADRADLESIHPLVERLQGGVPDWVGVRRAITPEETTDDQILRRRAARFTDAPGHASWTSALAAELDFFQATRLSGTVHRALTLLDTLRAQGIRSRFTGDFSGLNMARAQTPGAHPGDFNPYQWHNPDWNGSPVIEIDVEASRLEHAREIATRGTGLSPILIQPLFSPIEAIRQACAVSGLNLHDNLILESEFGRGRLSLDEKKLPEGGHYNRAVLNALELARVLVGNPSAKALPSTRFAFLPANLAIPHLRGEGCESLTWEKAGDYLGGEFRLAASREMLGEAIVLAEGRQIAESAPVEVSVRPADVLIKAGLTAQEADSARRAIEQHQAEGIFHWQKKFDDLAVSRGVDLPAAQECFNRIVREMQSPPTPPSASPVDLTDKDLILVEMETHCDVGNLIPSMLARGHGITAPNWEAPRFHCSWEGESLRLGLNALCGDAGNKLLSGWGGLPIASNAADQWRVYFDRHAPGLWPSLVAGGWLPPEIATPTHASIIQAWSQWGWTWPHHPHDQFISLVAGENSRTPATILTQGTHRARGQHGHILEGIMGTTFGEKRYLWEPRFNQTILPGEHVILETEPRGEALLIKSFAPLEETAVDGFLLFWPEETPLPGSETVAHLERAAETLPHPRLHIQIVRRDVHGTMEALGQIRGAKSVWWCRALMGHLPHEVQIESTSEG
jgi:hypothetical protein